MLSARRFFLVFVVLFVVYAGLRSHTLLSKVRHDEGLFLAAGQACAMGELPYRDFVDHKPPGIFWFHAFPLRLFPYSRLAVKIHEVLWMALAGTLFWLLCRQLFSRFAAVVALGLFVFCTSTPVLIQSGGLTEEAGLPWYILAFFWAFLGVSRGLLPSFFAGLSLALAGQFRQTFVIAAPVFLWVLWREAGLEGLSTRDRLNRLILFAVGAVIPECLISLYFYCHGIWYEYIEANYLFNILYVAKRDEQAIGRQTWGELLRFIIATGPYLVAPLIAVGVLGRGRLAARRFLVPLLLIFACDLFAAELSGEDYEHYYVQAAVSSCLLIGLFIESCVHRSPEARRRWLRVDRILLALILFSLCGTAIRQYVISVHHLAIRYQRGSGGIAYQRSVADAVQRITEPDDRILLFGKSPNSVYFLAHRLPGARYYHNAPLFKNKFAGNIPERFYQRLIEDLKKRRPAVIILGAPEGESTSPGMDLVKEYVPEVVPILKKEYIPLEDVVEEVPDEWDWHGRFCFFLVRRDRVENVREAIQSDSQLQHGAFTTSPAQVTANLPMSRVPFTHHRLALLPGASVWVLQHSQSTQLDWNQLFAYRFSSHISCE